MPLHFFITTKSKIYPDFDANSEVHFFKKEYFKFIGIFSLQASRHCWVGRVGGFVAVHSQYTNTASWAFSLHPFVPGWGGGFRLENNPDYLLRENGLVYFGFVRRNL
jgi:hypothetical protein